MKKGLFALLVVALAGFTATTSHAIGETGITAYGTYWNGENEDGLGLGVKLTKSIIDVLWVDGSASYISFDPSGDSLVPLEATINVGLPGVVTPYAGIGAGYYFIDSPSLESRAGYLGLLGVEISIKTVGLLAELRYHDLEGDALDDLSLRFGVLLRF
ncbi:MAG: porin family protein [Kiritimatiellaceae bacterium]|nr:porin family protein [Kiritimatiellaceae bacterium]